MEKVKFPQSRIEELHEELPLLLLKGYESQARKWLEIITERSKGEDIENLIPYVYECLKRAEVTEVDSWLKKNNSSRDKIKELRMKGYKSEAEKMLWKTQIRVCEQDVTFEVNRTRIYLQKAKLSPEDIETSEDELDKLLEDGRIFQRSKDMDRDNKRTDRKKR